MSLAIGMGRYGFDAEVIGPAGWAGADKLRDHRVPFHKTWLARRYRPWTDGAAHASISIIARRRSLDLLHCHSTKAGVHGRLVGTRLGVPVIYTPNCFAFVGDVSPLRRLVAAALERRLGRSTALIICVSEDERREALKHRVGRPDRLRVVHNGVPPCSRSVPPDSGLLRFRGDGTLVAAIAVLRKQKALDALIDVVPQVLERVPSARIAIVGNGPEQKALEAHAASIGLGNEDRFAFFPFEHPIDKYLQATDLFVVPSAWEAFPLAIVKAMSCGVPVVASDVGGIREALTPETGVLAPPLDRVALAQALVDRLKDTQWRRAASPACRDRYARLFGENEMLAATVKLYAEVLAGGRTSVGSR